MNKTIVIFLTTISFVAIFSNTRSQETKYENVFKQFESELPKMMKLENVRGTAIAVTNKNGTIWSKTFGFTNDSKQFPINSNTNFSIQSATKALTSVAVLISDQEGKIDINQPISNYLEDFTTNSIWNSSPEKNITIQNLLNHTSGLTHETAVGNNYDLGLASFSEHVKSISDTWLQYPTGQRQHYSNLGLSLAGHILQTVNKKTYAESVRDLVLNPIGMNSSHFVSEKQSFSKNTAEGFSNHFKGVPFMPEGGIAAGGLYSNIIDMAKFARFILNDGSVDSNVILDSQHFKLLTTLPFQNEGQIQGFGMGLEVKNFGGYEIYMSPGRGFGFMGGIIYFPEEEIALIVLTNNEDTSIPMFAISSLMQNLTQQNPKIITSNFELPENAPKASLNLIRDFEGEYLNDYSECFVLTINDGKAAITIDSEEIEADFIVHNNELFARTTSTVFHFIHDKQNKIKYVADVYDSEVFYDFNPSCQEEKFKTTWNKFIGSYYLKKWDVRYENLEIHNKNGSLFLNNKKLNEVREDVFRDCNGNILDFSGETFTYKNVMLHKTRQTD